MEITGCSVKCCTAGGNCVPTTLFLFLLLLLLVRLLNVQSNDHHNALLPFSATNDFCANFLSFRAIKYAKTYVDHVPQTVSLNHHQQRRITAAKVKCTTRRSCGGVDWTFALIYICFRIIHIERNMIHNKRRFSLFIPSSHSTAPPGG